MTWEPILKGQDADTARAMIADIASSLWAPPPASADLALGDVGIALFFSYLAAVTDDEAADTRATELLSSAAARGPSLSSSFFAGYTGLGWVLEHLTDTSDEDANESIDRGLAAVLEVADWQESYDLINGLAGLALYALERLPRPSGVAALTSIVGHLEAMSESRDSMVTWLTRPHLLVNDSLAMTLSGIYNLGVAHGIPSVINVLARIVRRGIDLPRARPLLEGAVRWLLAQRRTHTSSVYPYWISDAEHQPFEFRLAWCYGDLGIAAALFGAARFIGEPEWESAALELARAAAERPIQTCGVVDAGLCHGAFGLAHMFTRLYNATREPWLRAAAIRWFRDGFSRRRTDEAFAGFPAWDVPRRSYVPDPGLLTGAAGIGLALLAATSNLEPAWDRVLLLDL